MLANSRMLTCPQQSIGFGLNHVGALETPNGPSRSAKNIIEMEVRKHDDNPRRVRPAFSRGKVKGGEENDTKRMG